MSIRVTRVRGHYAKSSGQSIYDGLIEFRKGETPDVIEVDGVLYQKVEKPAGYVNQEMHMHKETR